MRRPRFATAPAVAGMVAATMAVAAAYAGAMHGPFVFDDHNTLVYNTGIRRIAPLRHFLSSNRPLTDFLFALTAHFGGGTPAAHHAVSIVLHMANVWLVWALGLRLLSLAGPPGRQSESGRRGRRVRAGGREGASPAWPGAAGVAAVAAAWFGLHPLQTEAVAYISSQSELLASLFYLLGVLFYVQACTARHPRSRLAAAAAIPLATTAAIASKEMAATLPLALLLVDLCFVQRRTAVPTRQRLGVASLSLLPFLAAVPRLWDLAFSASTAGFRLGRIGPMEYLLTQPGVIGRYARLTVLPLGQCFDYDWALVRSAASPSFWLPAAGVLGLVTLAARLRRRMPLACFAVLWPLLILLPTSSVVPLADPIAERRMYLALAGPLLLAAELLARACGRLGRRRVALAAGATLIAAVLGWATARRAQLWGDPVELYAASAACAPGNPRARLNYGATLLNAGRLEDAARELRAAKTLYEQGASIHAFDRVGAFIHYNLAVIEFARGHPDRARPLFVRALELGGRFVGLRPMASFYLGHIARRAGRWDEALQYYEDAYANAVTDVRQTIRLHLAQALAVNGRVEEARAHLKAILKRNPENATAIRILQQLDARGTAHAPPATRRSPEEAPQLVMP